VPAPGYVKSADLEALPMIRRLLVWGKAARYHALPQIVMPWVLGGLVALAHGQFDALLYGVTLLGLVLAHLGTNLLDDCFDFATGSPLIRRDLQVQGVRARMGKCQYILDGTMSIVETFLVAAGLFCLAFAVCLYLTWRCGWPVLAISVSAAVISLLYSAPPVRLSYRGLGELTVGFTMGPLTVIGTYYVLTQQIRPEPILASIPIGLLISNVLYCHSIMDFDADKANRKITLAVALGSKGRAVAVLPVLIAVAYGTIVVGVVGGQLPSPLLLALVSAPMAIALVASMRGFLRDPEYEPPRRWWMGPMEHWDDVEAAGIGWFMVRWYMARNLLTATTLLILLAWLIELGS